MAIQSADSQPESNPHKSGHNITRHQTMNNDSVSVSEKVDKLKSLNALLLKETVEKRQQVESLAQSNRCLESQFNRSVMDNASLQSEMNSLTETAVKLEIEKGLLFDFMTVLANQVVEEMIGRLESDMRRILEEKSEIERLTREKESEIADLKRRLDEILVEIDEERRVSARVSDERDEIRVLLDARVQEVNELMMKGIRAEENEARVLKEVAGLNAEFDRLMAENTDSKKQIESVTKVLEDVETRLVESNSVVDELQRSMAKLLEEKKAIEDEKIIQDGKNSKLQTSVNELKKLVEGMRIAEGALLEKFADLERKYAASSKHEEEMKIEINELVEENKETERRIEHLAEEKSSVAKDLEDAKKELQQQKLIFEQTVQEKVKLENAKVQGESEIAKKDEQLNTFKDMVASLEMSNAHQIEKIKELEVESGRYKSSFDQAAIERDEALKQLNEQKAITDDLKQTITGMEKEMQDLHEKLATLTAENEKHIGEKNRLEDRCAGLVKEVAVLEASFAESQIEFDSKLNAAEAKSNRVLNILKKTVLVCDGNSDFDQENGVEEGIKEHVAGIEAIKKAFKDKESVLEEMKLQLELVKSCAKKEKGFWTMVSSATTLLAAAASLAYVVRAH